MHFECRYCDKCFPTSFEGDTICTGCGARWKAANIVVEVDEE